MNYRDLNLSRASSEQNALKWLDPIYTPIDLDNTLHERWDYQSLLLDPWSEYLDDIEGSTLGDIHDPYFGIIRFPITLEPMKKQTLIVDYLQDLSWTGKTKNDSFCGLVYIMEPAQRWGIWEQTTIQIHIPTGMKKVAIRPRPSNITHSKKMTTYTIKMGRPYENLYVSLVP